MEYDNHRKENFYVITGGPGVGKTTLLDELSVSGFKIVPEDARQVIKQQVRENGQGLPWKNKELYTHLMFEASVKSYESLLQEKPTSIYFFDRGVIDAVCYASMIGLLISPRMDNIARSYDYNRNVFILPPWLEIYHTDDERKQSWEEATFTFEKLKAAYTSYGYNVIEVPKESVTKRVSFVLSNIK